MFKAVLTSGAHALAVENEAVGINETGALFAFADTRRAALLSLCVPGNPARACSTVTANPAARAASATVTRKGGDGPRRGGKGGGLRCPEVVITDEGITVRETADTIRLRQLITGIGVAPRRQLWFQRARLVGLLFSRTSVWFGKLQG